MKGTPTDVAKRALNKLVLLDTATRLEDLGKVPGNVLEPLKGDRKGQHSIRVNQQWRICFTRLNSVITIPDGGLAYGP